MRAKDTSLGTYNADSQSQQDPVAEKTFMFV